MSWFWWAWLRMRHNVFLHIHIYTIYWKLAWSIWRDWDAFWVFCIAYRLSLDSLKSLNSQTCLCKTNHGVISNYPNWWLQASILLFPVSACWCEGEKWNAREIQNREWFPTNVLCKYVNGLLTTISDGFRDGFCWLRHRTKVIKWDSQDKAAHVST